MKHRLRKIKRKHLSSQEIAYIILNVIAWIIVLVWPVIQGMQSGAKITEINIDYFIVYCGLPVMFIVLFYFNFYYLIDRLWLRSGSSRVWFVVWNVLIILMIALGTYYWQDYFMGRLIDNYTPITLTNTLFLVGTVLTMTVGLAVTLKYTINFQRAENERVRLESERREAELKNLRAQLNPHFLFNAMNNIYALMTINPDKAQHALYNLSKILRYVLYEDDQVLVPLSKELDFMRSYIDVMKLRLTDNVSLEVDISDDNSGVMVAPLMFMSLVENAFKHGVSQTHPSYIRIAITSATDDKGGKSVVCRVDNSYYPKTDADRSGSGIGIENLRRRLSLLYPSRNVFEMSHDDDNFHTELKLYM